MRRVRFGASAPCSLLSRHADALVDAAGDTNPYFFSYVRKDRL